MRRRLFVGGGKGMSPSKVPDGIYAVYDDLTLSYWASKDPSIIGIALVHKGHRFMIEKYEEMNRSYQQASAGKASYSSFYWGEYFTDQSLDNYNMAVSNIDEGCLRDENGRYDSVPHLPYNISEWGTGALSDWKGRSNSEILKTLTHGGGSGTMEYTQYATVGHVLNTFLSSSDAKGFDDWYIPSCAQLALIFMNLITINRALSYIEGNPLHDDEMYWSSTECNEMRSWEVFFTTGSLSDLDKLYGCNVRFIKDI